MAATFAEYLDEHPQKRAAIERQLDLYDQQRRDPWGYAADARGILRIAARCHQVLGVAVPLDPPVEIHKADMDWLAEAWLQEDLFEWELWQAGIGVAEMREMVTRGPWDVAAQRP